MRERDTLSLAAGALRAQMQRTLLVVLATAIGVAAVVLLTALGDGARHFIVDEFAALGTDLVIVIPGRNETTGGPPPLFGETPRDLTLRDAMAVARHPHVATVAPVIVGGAPVSTAAGIEREVSIIGTSAEMLSIRRLHMRSGRFLPSNALDRAAPVCVLGALLAVELFPRSHAVGAWIRIGEHRFRVIGVLAKTGTSIGMDFDDLAFVPVAAAQNLFDRESLFRLLVTARAHIDLHHVAESSRQVIARQHDGEDDVTIITQDSVVGTFDRILRTVTFTIAGISSISLLVAGVLIMNVMLVTVAQRRAEIGLLKALGARVAEVRGVFLTEALLLSAAGGLVGLLAGCGGAAMVRTLYPSFPAHVPWWGAATALGIALASGVVFGVRPAQRAAALSPIDALVKR